MTAFDLLIRGGTVIDGTGTPGVRADVGVAGDRSRAVGDLSHVDPKGVALVLDATDRVVCPGFIDPHGHSDATILLDGAIASHLHQGFTTQLSGNCGDSLAPVTRRSRPLVELSMATIERGPAWRTFAGYLEAVERGKLGPNHAFLVGHGTIRGAVLGTDARPATDAELKAMVRHLREALDAGAIGLSSGLIYPPGIHAPPEELVRLAAATAKRGALYATHLRNESAGLLEALDEALATIRAAGPGARLQVSHLKAGALAVHGRGPEAVARLEAARSEGLDVGADQYPYTAAAATLQVVLPPALLALPIDDIVAALGDWEIRARIKREVATGAPGWEDTAADPGWQDRIATRGPMPTGRPQPGRARRRDGPRPGGRRLRPAGRRPARRVDRHRLHERADVGRSCRSHGSPSARTPASPPRAPDPGTGVPHPRAPTAAPARLRRPSASARRPAARTAIPNSPRSRPSGWGCATAGGPAEAFANLAVSTRRPFATGDVPRPHRHPTDEHVIVNGVRRSSTGARRNGPAGSSGAPGDPRPSPTGGDRILGRVLLAGGSLDYTLRRSRRAPPPARRRSAGASSSRSRPGPGPAMPPRRAVLREREGWVRGHRIATRGSEARSPPGERSSTARGCATGTAHRLR